MGDGCYWRALSRGLTSALCLTGPTDACWEKTNRDKVRSPARKKAFTVTQARGDGDLNLGVNKRWWGKQSDSEDILKVEPKVCRLQCRVWNQRRIKDDSHGFQAEQLEGWSVIHRSAEV